MFNEKIIKELGEVFKGLKEDVVLKFFTQENECRFCKDTRELVNGVVQFSDKLKMETYDFAADKAEAEKHGVDKIPAIVVMGKEDYGIRFYGIPGGYEFASLIEAIKLVSTGKHDLDPQTQAFLDGLDKDIHFQVFVTPTCPYCPGAVVLAHRMAYYSGKVKADMVEATEFPHLAQKYQVMGVPRTIINEKEFIEGAAPEKMVIEKLKSI